jgi:small subunit ribosomal protein S1
LILPEVPDAAVLLLSEDRAAMLDKKDDAFFNEEKSAEDEASRQLLNMISASADSIKPEFAPGSKVTGKVTKIGPEYVFVDIGGKSDAVISVGELANKSGEVPLTVGDEITSFVVSNSSSETVLSKSLAGRGRTAATQELYDAMNGKVPVQGKVTGVNKGGINVKVLGNRAFCPSSQIDIKFTEDINSYLGKTLDFVITRITEGGRNIVLSRIPLLEGDLEKKIDDIAKAVETHAVLRGTITRITDFGLFVSLGEVEGLVHISEVSWERAENLAESYNPGQQVECVALGVEKKSPLRNSKISLSIKQTIDNPWKSVSSKFSVGQQVAGRVTKLMPFGAFVEIAPGIEGLVHVSEMSWIKRVHHPSDVVAAGQQVQVMILGIDETKKTVSLTLKDISSDPWRDAESRFPAGADAAGMVARKAKFGYFIDLAEGVTGLLPLGNIAPEKKDALKEGTQITVHIESIDTAARRLSLSFGRKEERQNDAAVNEYLAKQRVAPQPKSTASQATEFGSALLDALKKKNQ